MTADAILTIPPAALEELKDAVGADALSFDAHEIRELSADASVRSKKAEANDTPLAAAAVVVRPTSTGQVSALMAWATGNHIPVTPRGLGSGVVGAGLPIRGGVLLDMTGFDAIGEVDVMNRLVTVGSGVRLSDLDEAIADTGLSVGHYPQSFYLASVGGCIAMRGSGTFSSLHGNIEDRIGDLEVVLPTGEVVQTHSIPRASMGIDLKSLFSGSEGMFGVVTHVTLKLVPLPKARLFNSLHYDSFEPALETVRRILLDGVHPAVVRIYDPVESFAKHARFADKAGWLLVLVFDGAPELVTAQQQIALRHAGELGGEELGPEPAINWEARRFDWSWHSDHVSKAGGVAEAIEVAATWSQLPALYENLKKAAAPHMQNFMAHVSHVYDQGAALYAIVQGDFDSDAEAMTHYDAVFAAIVDEAQAEGVVLGHHHGVGLERAPWMRATHGNGLDLMRTLQKAVDPAGIMNPGKDGM